MQRRDPGQPWQSQLHPAIAMAVVLALAAACTQAPDSVVGEVRSPTGESDPEGSAEGTARQVAGVRIPERFHGEWQRDPVACGNADEGRLLIGPGSVRFHESVGALQALHANGERLDVALQLRGEGQSWEATYRFRLSEDGSRLTDLSSGNGMVRLRCT